MFLSSGVFKSSCSVTHFLFCLFVCVCYIAVCVILLGDLLPGCFLVLTVLYGNYCLTAIVSGLGTDLFIDDCLCGKTGVL